MSVPRLRRRVALLILVITAAVVVIVDHIVKALIVHSIALGDEVPDGGRITLHHIHNTGAAFSLFPRFQALFLGVAVAVSLYILIAGWKLGGPLVQVALGLILGGAISNAVDRAAQGYVVDFVDFHIWPVFNVADTAIVIGVAACALLLSVGPNRALEPSGPPSR